MQYYRLCLHSLHYRSALDEHRNDPSSTTDLADKLHNIGSIHFEENELEDALVAMMDSLQLTQHSFGYELASFLLLSNRFTLRLNVFRVLQTFFSVAAFGFFSLMHRHRNRYRQS